MNFWERSTGGENLSNDDPFKILICGKNTFNSFYANAILFRDQIGEVGPKNYSITATSKVD